jgi:hypothetical protein
MRIVTAFFHATILMIFGLSSCSKDTPSMERGGGPDPAVSPSKEAKGEKEAVAAKSEVANLKTDWGEKVADASKLLKSKYWAKTTQGLIYTIDFTGSTAKFEYSGKHGNSVSVCKFSLHKVSEDTYNLALKKCTGVDFDNCGGIELTPTDGWNTALVTDHFNGPECDGYRYEDGQKLCADSASGSCAELAELSTSPLGSPQKQVPSKTTATEPTPVNVGTGGNACTAYVECVCDLSDAIDGKAGMVAPANCAEMKRLYGALGSMGNNESVCETMLKALKDGLQPMAALYEMNNITIPSSCR